MANKVLIENINHNSSTLEVKDQEYLGIEVDNILAFLGVNASTENIKNWDIALEKSYISVDNCTMQTSRTGIFAAGDVVKYNGKLKLIATGFAEIMLGKSKEEKNLV